MEKPLSRFAYALTALLLLAGPAFAQNPYAVGDTITNPFTGATETVEELLGDTMVLTDLDNAIRVADIAVGDTFDDPDNPGTTLEVIAVRTNAVTNLTDQVTVTDNAEPPAVRTIDVVEPVDDSPPPGTEGAPGSPAGPVTVPVPVGNINVVTNKQEGANGAGGRDGFGIGICIIECFTIGRVATVGEAGGTGPAIDQTIDGPNIEAISTDRPGVWISSTGGDGGVGGDAVFGLGIAAAQGGAAGAGGDVEVTSNVDIATSGDGGYGMFIQSRGGEGGEGGNGFIANTAGGGGAASTGGTVEAVNNGTITTSGAGAIGMLVQSLGGGGGSGGDSYGIVGAAGTASEGGDGGTVTATNNGSITTTGANAHGVLAESIGGDGGDGGAAGGILAVGATGDAGGDGGMVTVTNETGGRITTVLDGSFGIFAQSIGGGGGNGGNIVGLFSIGATGDGGGSSDEVSVTNRGEVTTAGNLSHGVVAQSIGGGGGSGSSGSGAFVTIGGGAGAGGGSAPVKVDNHGTITTTGDRSHGLLAQSLGGGGGTGGSVASASAFAGVAIGGAGGDGGNASTVTVTSFDGATISTDGVGSKAILAQSVGGGGGDGGFSAQVTGGYGLGVSVAVGGSGGGGGTGGRVEVNGDSTLITLEDNSQGIFAQSVGGGGGDGGFAFSFAGAGGETGGAAISVGVGGKGGIGGLGGAVAVNAGGSITTSGDDSDGLVAQSTGGGGGNGAFSISIGAAGAGAVAGAVSVGVGGGGGGGGNGGLVDARYTGDITTGGHDSHGAFVQSIGGGGGDGGFNVSGAVSGGGSGSGSVTVGVGGFGGDGGDGGEVIARIVGDLETVGDRSSGLIAQSTGGGGGNGAFNVSGSITGSAGPSGAVTVGVGGSGGGGGDGTKVDALLQGDVTTNGDEADGVLVQSVGGAGGNGAFNVSGAISIASGNTGAISVGVGGSGGDGGKGGEVLAEVIGDIETSGVKSSGFIAQSLGGSGGNGKFNVSGSLAASSGTNGTVAVGVGGSGGGGGDGGNVTAKLAGDVTTKKDDAKGVVAQSLGGSGGHGAFNVSGGLSLSSGSSGSVSVGVGGAGGGGGNAAVVDATLEGDVATEGDRAEGVLIQSLGGGGGDGAFNVAGGLSLSQATGGAVAFGVGGFGGDGGTGSTVKGIVTGDVSTQGDESAGVLAQSVGGGGGQAAFNVTGGVALSLGSTSTTTLSTAIGVGGFGGGGGDAGTVTLTRTGDTSTDGTNSHGVLAQSLGGNGGNGAFNISGGLSAGFTAFGTDKTFTGTIGVGGFGGGGGDAKDVVTKVTGDVHAPGFDASLDNSAMILNEDGLIQLLHLSGSHGVLAQSVGGGGGTGAFNVNGGIALAIPDSGTARLSALNLGTGGWGGSGGDAGMVDLNVNADIVKSVGDERVGVGAQSVGGSGGQGGVNVTGGIVFDGQITAGVGGFGGSGGLAKPVIATANTDIEAEGVFSIGFMAQSVGGGGGMGNVNVSGGLQPNTDTSVPSLIFGVGGFGGAGNSSDTVTATQHGDITVDGFDSIGVLVQSVAGGGGAGGLNVSGNGSLGKGYVATVGVGGFGGTGASAGAVTLTSDGDIDVDARSSTANLLPPGERESIDFRDRANGILVQSIGGGGGKGGANISGALAPFGSPLALGVGGFGSGGGDAGTVTVRRGTVTAGLIKTEGHGANALTAQSIGGGGGDAGMNIVIEGSGFTPKSGSKQVAIVIGGRGGDPGHGQIVDVTHVGDIETKHRMSDGILAQSIGGGGGNAAMNLGLGVNRDAKGINIGVGGAPGDGGNGAKVLVDHTGDISTDAADSTAIFAQSIGGGGGNAALNVALSLKSEGSLDMGLGRFGGTGGTGGDVEVKSAGALDTQGDRAVGIRAQSVGNGGGLSGAFSAGVSAPVGDAPTGPSKATLAIGLEGGTGGTAGRVDVDAKGSIETEGEDAHAIHAQSIGGGGGVGGSALNVIFLNPNAVGLGVGGEGGSGGTSGVIDVDNEAELRTQGDGSHGIYAQSIGGAGGTGGYAGVAKFNPGVASTSQGSLTGTLSVGGKGGTGSAGNTVDIKNDGEIVTEGRKAFGVNAESIGGGGGDGGAVINAALAGGTQTGALTIDVGGKGNVGGAGALVKIVNEGRIHTHGDESVGIHARSVGGGGGDAGLVAQLSIGSLGSESNSISYTHNVGGEGGSGNVGGEVIVTNGNECDPCAGRIITEGAAAHGIVAESLGGGGGSGGSVISANGTRGQLESILIGVNVGGDGGAGGSGGKVTVTNEASIETKGDGAHGIIARSVGGGGGSGGLVLATNLIFSAAGHQNAALIVAGGAGGTGNGGGEVIVTNDGSILTGGERAHGIHAQSIGGGGGNAGIGLGVTSGAATTAIAGALSALFGGRGGDGGAGGPVTVNHHGDITVHGDNSQAVIAESINGGGGRIALDFNGITSLPGFESVPGQPEGTETEPVFVFGGGGEETENSNAGLVTLNYTGTFGVAGDNGAGNVGQSIGGGGGTYEANLSILDSGTAPEDRVQFRGRLGGRDGVSNDGGEIDGRHEGDVVTLGTNTPGLFLQSIGGGGGRASLDVTTQTGTLGAAVLTLGGEDGIDESGGLVRHVQRGSIATSGGIAHGAILQSIGGGGGLLSLTGAAASLATLTLGSLCGDELDGGAIDLQLTGDVATDGASSVGLLIQSIGGGGGTAGVLGTNALDVTLGGSDEASGHGGALTVTNTGNVSTLGARAHGVILQSIGGGGGAVFTDAATPAVHLSSGNDGDGGSIAFTQVGDILTLGSKAFGLFAQSLGGGGGFVDGASAHAAGGAGAGGDIDLLVTGNIATLAPDSTALYVHSAGGDGAGDIALQLSAGGNIVGGADGTGIVFDGGASNHFENHGSVTTLAGAAGLAFKGGDGDDVIDNHGVILGNMDLGGGANGVTNHEGATLYSGEGANLGAADTLLRQNGLLAPGAAALAVTTALNGSLMQSAGARSEFELDFASGTTDALMATGTVALGGTLDVSLIGTHAAKPGTYSNVLYHGAQGLTDDGLTMVAQPSVVVSYDLLFPGSTTAALAYSVNFAPAGLIGNRREIGEYVNRVQTAGGNPALDDTIRALVAQSTMAEYSKLLTQLGAEFYAEQQVYTLDSVQRFTRVMQDCGALNVGRIFRRDSGCAWVRVDADSSNRAADAQGFPASEQTTRRFSQGFQHTPDAPWTYGIGVSFEDNDSDAFDGTWNGDVRTAQLGLLARREFGRVSAGATVALGHSSQDVRRSFSSAQRDVSFATGVFEVAHYLRRQNVTITPTLNLGFSSLSGESVDEAGIDMPNASIAGGTETHAWLEPAVAFGFERELASRKRLRAYARLGFLQYLTDTASEVRAGLADAPAGVETMRIVSDLDRRQFIAEGGFELLASERFTLGLSYATQDSRLRDTATGTLRLRMPLN